MTGTGPESCADCGRMDCRLSYARRGVVGCEARTAYVLDAVWPEHRAFVDATRRPGDQVLAPSAPVFSASRYDWGAAQPVGATAVVARHLRMRRVARAPGSVRQAAYLRSDAAVAAALARRLDFRARHLVISQTLLPHLWRSGVLGGREFDVLLTRYSLRVLQARLDAAAQTWPGHASLSDFRAPGAIVDAEEAALEAARSLITPHAELQALFGARAVRLAWAPPAARTPVPGERVAFLGPTAARQGAIRVREIARGLPEPLIVFGADLEGPDFWSGVPIERRRLAPGWLDGIGAVLHPALATHEPRRLLEARAAGVRIYASPACGLPRSDWLDFETFRPGESGSAGAGSPQASRPADKLTLTVQ